ncbi:signal transduction histidine kinase [Nocardioides sp. BE266]|uniref:ATP-binding protein n=1 Tax=Nocardioides sp. BE266 TaxID=2817725 RepID=UPI00285DDBE5|nr:ATP-binding protein [Nocardioides sp. BE266]MDR7252818.1 signal transduction histidine kinase [Nocardioides sp. BE266]
MVFSEDRAMRRSDLLDVVSVLDVETVLERAASVAVDRTGAQGVVLVVVDEPGEHEPAAEGGARGETVLLANGTGEDDGVAVRERLGTTGLRGEPGARPDQDLARLSDPATGREVLRVPVVVGARLYADLVLLDPPDGFFHDDDVDSISALGRVTGVAVRNALSYSLSERRREALELAAAVDRSVHPPFLLSDPLTRISEGALRIAGARTAVVVSTASDGIDVSAGAGITDEALGRTLSRVTEQVRTAQDDGEEFLVRLDDMTAWGIPLNPEHAFAGVVVAMLEPTDPDPSAEDRDLLGSFVRHSSLVLDHAVLLQERQHAVLAADRDRIARDLHDGVIQRLYATALKLRAGIRSGDDAGGHGDEAVREIGDSIRDIRGTVFELERGRPASLRSDVLAMAKEYESVLGFVPVVRSWGPVDSMVGQELADQVTVVLREALSNCARHAGAGRVEVDVAVESGWFTLWVTDDGRGMSGSDLPGSGLRNLRKRATALGGDLDVQAADPRGTVLQWRVPLGA